MCLAAPPNSAKSFGVCPPPPKLSDSSSYVILRSTDVHPVRKSTGIGADFRTVQFRRISVQYSVPPRVTPTYTVSLQAHRAVAIAAGAKAAHIKSWALSHSKLTETRTT